MMTGVASLGYCFVVLILPSTNPRSLKLVTSVIDGPTDGGFVTQRMFRSVEVLNVQFL